MSGFRTLSIIDLALDSELTKWFKSHSDYQPGAQPENNKGVVMSEPNPIHI